MSTQNNLSVLTPNEKVATIREFLQKREEHFKAVLPKHISSERLIKIVLASVSRTPSLMECSPQSIFRALMQAADLGLEPNTPLQHAHLIPYNNTKTGRKEAQFQPGFRGFIKLAVQSGEVQSITPYTVYEKEVERGLFEIEYGLEPKILHRPLIVGKPGVAVAYYAVAKMADGTTAFCFMTRQQVEDIRTRSQSPNAGPWVTDFDAMATKTCIKRLCKYLPLSTERLGRAIHHDNLVEAGEPPDYSDVLDTTGQVVPPVAENDANTKPEQAIKAADRAKADIQARAAKLETPAAV